MVNVNEPPRQVIVNEIYLPLYFICISLIFKILSAKHEISLQTESHNYLKTPLSVQTTKEKMIKSL